MSVAEDKTYTIISWHLDIDFGIKIKTNTTNRNQSFQNIIMSKLWLECFWITNTENPFCEWFFSHNFVICCISLQGYNLLHLPLSQMHSQQNKKL